MSTTLTVSNVTATSADIAFTNLPAGGTVEIQIADNPNFYGLVTWRRYAATPAAIINLNQSATLYARGRTVTGAGVAAAWGETIGFRTLDNVAWNTAPQAVMVSPGFIVVPEPILKFHPPTSGLAAYPATNLLRDDPQLTYAHDGTGNAQTRLFFETAGAPVDTFALLDNTLCEGTLITLRAADDLATLTSAGPWPFTANNLTFRASPNLPQRAGYHGLLRLAAPQKYRFWNILTSSVTTAGVGARQGLHLMRYLVHGLARTAKNISADKTESPLDLGSLDRNRAGGPNRVWGHRMRKVDFEIALMSEMQWETQFADLWRKIGSSEPVLVVPNSKSGAFLHDRILYGGIPQARAVNVNSPLFTMGLSVESLI